MAVGFVGVRYNTNMRVILTHEQADFDAMAALLGAWLLDENALAVLPRRMNRNARAYLALYATELPFVDPRDLPGEAIEAVTLVDTQSLVTIKGMTKRTSVAVLDHHPRREDLPVAWQLNIDRTGATTTLLVESIAGQSANSLSSTEATLLLLGIYEDTGSLTYAGTTPRDVKAAAWLIEHGASLKVLGQFLDPPLSPEQRVIYKKLMEDSRSLTIQGQRVILSSVEAESMTDEISSIAHKMREVLDPDGLFILVSTSEGIRIVARSISDKVNVARILAKFGGGGHDRAASCLIQTSQTDDKNRKAQISSLINELQKVIESEIPPMTTVGQIMSKNPRLISPETPAEEALVLMRRYGYEGFPVSEGGQVVGLLTRRAVDRSLTHKLNLPAASLMDAGRVVIHADAPIDDLRDLIVASGWGQIPVIDPVSGKVVGIATRTDLIKIMTPAQTAQRHANLAEKLEAALPPIHLALLKEVVALAVERHMAVYIVGGFVRDLLLDRPGIDFDLVVEGDALSLGRRLAKKFGGRTVTHARFGTAKWFIPRGKEELAAALGQPNDSTTDLPDSLDLISARTEFYDYPTALPTVESSGIKLDLHRRDFTINTLALRLDGRHYGELHDYWGGLKDLRKGVIRVLHSLSFIDDPTRLLRAARFEQRFGFKIEKRTLELMKNSFEVMKQVSGDRLRHEFNLILQEPQAGAILKRLTQLGVLASIHPAIGSLELDTNDLPVDLDQRILEDWSLPAEAAGMQVQLTLNWLVWLGRIPPDSVDKLASRLRLPAALKTLLSNVLEISSKQAEIAQASPGKLVAILERAPMLAIYAVCIINRDQLFTRQLESFAMKYRHIHPGIDGKDLTRMGLKPSPRIRAILNGLRSAWLDGTITSKDEENALLQELLEKTGSDDGTKRSDPN
jgi:tRNA nucleotidyltransferase (CCA-adding enzyme)